MEKKEKKQSTKSPAELEKESVEKLDREFVEAYNALVLKYGRSISANLVVVRQK